MTFVLKKPLKGARYILSPLELWNLKDLPSLLPTASLYESFKSILCSLFVVTHKWLNSNKDDLQQVGKMPSKLSWSFNHWGKILRGEKESPQKNISLLYRVDYLLQPYAWFISKNVQIMKMSLSILSMLQPCMLGETEKKPLTQGNPKASWLENVSSVEISTFGSRDQITMRISEGCWLWYWTTGSPRVMTIMQPPIKVITWNGQFDNPTLQYNLFILR